ncbi:MAG: hypothetical protein KGI29_04920 [Pseudomonadota bacterium]|nr:hypothetical protein [Pseudomonadota bacterium]MDE3038463.1 hypothetical protein [Pseudomonadota bacterium]
MSSRLDDAIRLYSILDCLRKKVGGTRKLSCCNGKLIWPQRGVYFFMENGEDRTDTGHGQRIVRIGTHALKVGSQTTLWKRLSQHKGQEKSGSGNHRGSIFRLIVGTALNKNERCTTWGKGNTAKGEVRKTEEPLEREVSQIIRDMPFLWLEVNDDPDPGSLRGYIERNVIALLSNYRKSPIDPSSLKWLGRSCNRDRVRDSGLWNQNHVAENYDPPFLDALERLVETMKGTL